MHTVTLEEAQAKLPELVAQAQQGEEVVITKDNQPVATLNPTAGWPLFGILKGRMTIAPDFDAPLEDFRSHVE